MTASGTLMRAAPDAALSAADAGRLARLRRMKVIALALLLIAAIVYLATLRLADQGVWGFVNAGAEAAMVGALADWFAVTALFKRPLGLPIPHTAIIPTRKNAIGRNLGDFVGTNFLAEDVVRQRLSALDISTRLGAWLSDYSNARRVSSPLATLS